MNKINVANISCASWQSQVRARRKTHTVHRCIGVFCLFALVSVPLLGFSKAPPEPATGVGLWALLPDGSRPLHRHECVYVRVGKRFYLIGGRGINPIKPVEIFDPETKTWTEGAAPPVELHHFQAVQYESKIYVVGAMTTGFLREPPLPNIYIYDPARDRWSMGAAIPADRRRGGAGAVVYKGEIYLVNGIQVGHWAGHVAWFDAFNPKTQQWRRLPDSPHPRDHFQAAVIDNKLYVAGGRRSSIATNQALDLTVPEVDVYDFHSARWSTLSAASNIPTPRAGSTSVALKEHLIVIGRESSRQHEAHSEVESLDTRTGKWKTLAPMSTGRHATQAILYKKRVYIAAGSATQGATEINSQDVFTLPR